MQIKLGQPDDLPQKLALAQAAVGWHGGAFARRAACIDVSSPQQPVYTLRADAGKPDGEGRPRRTTAAARKVTAAEAPMVTNVPPQKVTSQPRQSWWASLLILCAILGALLGLSFKSRDMIRRQGIPADNYPGAVSRIPDRQAATPTTSG